MLRFEVEFDRGNGTERIVLGPVAIIAWERKTKSKISQASTVGLGLDDLAFMVFETLRTAKDETLPAKYDDFIAQLTAFGEADDSDPLASQPDEEPSSD